jgi:uncharacterized membrane protein YedE/YeeE
MGDMEISTLMGLCGLIVGILFGALTHRTNFCTMGSISDAISFGDFRRARAWLLAIAVSILGAQFLHYMEAIDITRSIYLGTSLNWTGAIIGGSIFGFGMVLASGCPGRNLVRVGGGDLKALVVLLFIGVFGYMSLRGLTAPVRAELATLTSIDLAPAGMTDQHMGTILSGLSGLPAEGARLALATIIPAILIVFCFKSAEFRHSPGYIAVGIGVGLLVTAGWYVTGVWGNDEFDPVQITSLTFIAPSANGLQYLMTFTGATITFGVATVGGAILGAFLSAITSGKFIMTAFFDKKDTLRHMIGGAMMGTGGVMALGCTIGQGITGMSTLSLGSLLALLAIVAGGYAGIKYMERLVGI